MKFGQIYSWLVCTLSLLSTCRYVIFGIMLTYKYQNFFDSCSKFNICYKPELDEFSHGMLTWQRTLYEHTGSNSPNVKYGLLLVLADTDTQQSFPNSGSTCVNKWCH